MDTIFPPSKIARLTDSGSGCWSMRRSGSPPIGLGLALGSGGGSTGNPEAACGGKSFGFGFTIVQVQELQLQTVIYKYIESGCPVPYHLLVPIWRSISNSFGTLNSNLCYPATFMRGNRQMQLEYRNGMDPEPGRCRRTDGKKWRCNREAVADQKYCERHMHRGRQRTRKLMEVAAHINNYNNTSTNLSISINPSPNSVNFSTGKN